MAGLPIPSALMSLAACSSDSMAERLDHCLASYSTLGGKSRALRQAQDIGKQAKSSRHTFRQLTVQCEGPINVRSLSVTRIEQATLLRILIRIVHFGESNIAAVPALHEAVAPFFNPTIEVCRANSVRPAHQRVSRFEHSNSCGFVDYLLRIGCQ